MNIDPEHIHITDHAIRQFQTRIARICSIKARSAIVDGLIRYSRNIQPSKENSITVRVRNRHGYNFRAVIGPAPQPQDLSLSVITILRSGAYSR